VITAAIESLSVIKGDEARNAIIGMLGSRDNEIRRTAIIALSAFENRDADLLPFLMDPDWATRIAAVRALGKSPVGAVRKELEKLLDTEEDAIVIKAVEEMLRV